ncbi:MAG: hypothetical protein V4449_01780 [Patescibacteria group bacterium]
MASFERSLSEVGVRSGLGYASGRSTEGGKTAGHWTIAPFASGFIGGEKHGS